MLCRRLESVAMPSVCWSWSSPSFPRSGVRVGEVVEVVWWLSLAGEAVVPVKRRPFVPGFLPRSVGVGSGADGGFSGGDKERGGFGSDADWGAGFGWCFQPSRRRCAGRCPRRCCFFVVKVPSVAADDTCGDSTRIVLYSTEQVAQRPGFSPVTAATKVADAVWPLAAPGCMLGLFPQLILLYPRSIFCICTCVCFVSLLV